MAIKYSSPDVLLRRIDQKNRRKLFQTSLNISQGKRNEEKALEEALSKVDEIVLESESREAKRSKRMKRYSDVAGLLAMAAAGPLGLGVLGAGALYAGGRRIGSELGEKRAISRSGIEKRKGESKRIIKKSLVNYTRKVLDWKPENKLEDWIQRYEN